MSGPGIGITYRSGGNMIRAALFGKERENRSPAVVICHGAFEFKERYFELAAYLSERGITALVPDMNGHGESDGDRYHVNIHRWISDIRGALDFLIDETGVDPHGISAFGLSTGGTAVLEAALVEPRLRSLVVFAATVRNVMTPLDMLLYGALLPFAIVKKAVTGRPVQIPLRDLVGKRKIAWDSESHRSIIEDPRFQAAFVPIPGAYQASVVDTIDRVHSISVPTLVLHGENDEVDRSDSSRLLFERLTCEKKMIILPETGHAGCIDRHREAVFGYTADWIRGHYR